MPLPVTRLPSLNALRAFEAAARHLSFTRAAAELHVTLSASGAGGALNLSTVPSFAAKWLVPRLGRFRAAHPEIDLRIGTSLRLIDFAREDFDVAIRMGRGNYPGLRVDALFGAVMFPVCSPRLLAGPKPLSRPEDLR